jgi:hypothetical protein
MNKGHEVINLYDHPKYQERFDFADELGETATNHADEHYRQVLEESCDDVLVDLLGPLYSHQFEETPKDWSPHPPKKVGPNGLKRLCEALRKGRLHVTDQFIRDSLTFAWEDALSPDNGDIDYALSEAKEKFQGDWIQEEIWDPVLEKVPFYKGPDGPENIAKDLMRFVSQSGLNRAILFDFGVSPPVLALRRGQRVSWPALDQELAYIRDLVMDEFFKKLEKIMDDSDPTNRVNWAVQWRADLRDEKRVKEVQAELLDYLKGRQ